MSENGLERFKAIFWKVKPVWIAAILGIACIFVPTFFLLESSGELEGIFFNLPLVIYYDGNVPEEPLWVPPGFSENIIGTAGVISAILLVIGGSMALACAIMNAMEKGQGKVLRILLLLSGIVLASASGLYLILYESIEFGLFATPRR